MSKQNPNPRKAQLTIWLVLTLLILPPFLSASVSGNVEYPLPAQSYGTIASPPVMIQNGTTGTSTIYLNRTSAKVSVNASVPAYDYVLRGVNQVTDAWKIRLKAYSQSNITRLSNCTIYFHNASDGFSRQIYIINGSYTQQTGPWYDLNPLATVYMALTLQATGSQTSHVFVYLEILTPNKTTYSQYVLTFEIT